MKSCRVAPPTAFSISAAVIFDGSPVRDPRAAGAVRQAPAARTVKIKAVYHRAGVMFASITMRVGRRAKPWQGLPTVKRGTAADRELGCNQDGAQGSHGEQNHLAVDTRLRPLYYSERTP